MCAPKYRSQEILWEESFLMSNEFEKHLILSSSSGRFPMHISLFEALRASAVKKVVYPCLTEHFSNSPDGVPFVAELLASQVPVFHRTHFKGLDLMTAKASFNSNILEDSRFCDPSRPPSQLISGTAVLPSCPEVLPSYPQARAEQPAWWSAPFLGLR